MTNEKFKELMSVLSEQYQRKVTSLYAQVYWQALKQYSDDEVMGALIAYISDPDVCQYWPQPGALIAKIVGTTKQIEMSIESKAMAAWDEAYKAMMRKGQYATVALSDPLAMKVIEYMGGWPAFCMMRRDEEQWRRKEFISAYNNLAGSERLPKSLHGVGQKSQEKMSASRALDHIYKRVEGESK